MMPVIQTSRRAILLSAIFTASILSMGSAAAQDERMRVGDIGKVPAFRRTNGPVNELVVALSELDDNLLPFGETPPGWQQVGALEADHHEIERTGLAVEGDFTIRLTLSADRIDRAGFRLMLVGDGSDFEVAITGTKTNTWSDNETWEWQTPAGTTHVGLPIGPHVFTLQRRGELITLTADAVHRPDLASPILATFTMGEEIRFNTIRVATNGPAMRIDRLRLSSRTSTEPSHLK